MPDITITVKPSFNQVGRAIGSVDMQSFLREEINKIAALVERYGKQLSPVKTGRLRASIHFSPATTGLGAIVATGTNYAIYVHEGTRYMRARPFMEQGARFAEKEYEGGGVGDRLEKKFTDAFKKI